MPEYPLRCDVRRTESTTELLAQLHGSESGFQPYLLTAWSPELTAQDDISLLCWRRCSTSRWPVAHHAPDTLRPGD